MFSGRDHQSWSDDDSRYKEYAESSRRYSTSSHLEESGRRQQRLSPTYRHRRGSDRSFSSWSHDSFSEDNSHRSHGPSPSVASNSNRARFQSDGRKRRSKKTRRERKRRGMHFGSAAEREEFASAHWRRQERERQAVRLQHGLRPGHFSEAVL